MILNRVRIIILFSLALLTSAHAAMRFGLGNAVAKRSADLINSAGAAQHPIGDAVAATLPSCPAGPIYDTAPTDLGTLFAIDPLGHVSPPPHTFPSDHIYFYGSSTTLHAAIAPGDIHITDIASSEFLSAHPVFSDYAIYFYACKDVKTYFAHIGTLSPAVQAGLLLATASCSDYTTGGGLIHRCDNSVNITLQAGDLIGYGNNMGAFDFGSVDYRYVPAPFANPSRHTNTDQYYTVCPIDYFAPGPKAAMEALLGRFDGGYPRTTPPVCGQYNQDVIGSARGFWYHPGSPNIPEDPHLSFIYNNDYAPWETISVGTSLPNQVPAIFTFIPTFAGFVNREASQVTPDNNIYCYDTFYDPIGQIGAYAGTIVLLEMLNSTTLLIESQPAASCGAGPWAFTSNAVTFQR